MKPIRRSLGLLASSALSTALFVTAAAAQSVDAPAAGQLEEIVVTATRQTDTVSRVPLSISAATQQTLDQQGVKNLTDLSRTIPGLNLTGQTGGVANFAVRGVQSTAGAATTGVYLDDTPLTRRSTQGVAQLNGTPAPALFDLERIEVLRGPQGTLFGGSSQGGTIRFITPTPSLTRYSGYARAELSHTKKGDESYEGGIALGGPIIQDKLGFRASVLARHSGGWIDHVDAYGTGAVRMKDTNSSYTHAARLALAWQMTERLRATLAVFESKERTDDSNAFNLPNTEPGRTTSGSLTNNGGPAGGYSTPQLCFRGSPTAVPCTTPGAFVRVAQNYGPFPYLDGYNTIAQNTTPTKTMLTVQSLTLDYDFDAMSVKSITSYLEDLTKGVSNYAFLGNQIGTSPLFRPDPNHASTFITRNVRHGLVQELRFSSRANAMPFTWVGGVYYSNIKNKSVYRTPGNLDSAANLAFGATGAQIYGFTIPDPNVPGSGIVTARDQNLTDTDLAAFGEGNYWITDKLKATAGIRFSRSSFAYNQVYWGPQVGWAVPTPDNLGITGATVTESPITPKFGLQYQFNDQDMVYVLAAKGYRPGGVSGPIPGPVCAPAFAATGLTPADLPFTYLSDTVWSYEAGSKLRLFNNKLRIASSAFRIDWSNVQFNVLVGAGCGTAYVTNAGSARMQGFDIQADAVLFRGLTANINVGYNHARYTQTTLGPQPRTGAARLPTVIAGDTIPIPPWTVNIGARYDFEISSRISAFIRADYQYSSPYLRTFQFPVGGYAPDVYHAGSTNYVNARAGVTVGPWGFDLWARNLTNSQDFQSLSGGRTGCTSAECTSYSTLAPIYTATSYRPREIGATLAYRF